MHFENGQRKRPGEINFRRCILRGDTIPLMIYCIYSAQLPEFLVLFAIVIDNDIMQRQIGVRGVRPVFPNGTHVSRDRSQSAFGIDEFSASRAVFGLMKAFWRCAIIKVQIFEEMGC